MFVTRSTVLVFQYDLPNGYWFLNPTNLLVIPSTWTWTWSVNDPELFLTLFQWRLMVDTKFKTSLPVIWLEILTGKIRVCPYANEHKTGFLRKRFYKSGLILIDLVEDEERSSTNWSSNFDNARSKEKERIIHSSWSSRPSLISYFTLASAIEILIQIFNVITDYLPFVN